MAGVNENTRLALPLTMAASLLASAIAGTISATMTAYGFRDRALSQVNAMIDRSSQQIRKERETELKHYLTRETFQEWRQQERIRSDSQYYSLMNAIERLGAKVGR